MFFRASSSIIFLFNLAGLLLSAEILFKQLPILKMALFNHPLGAVLNKIYQLLILLGAKWKPKSAMMPAHFCLLELKSLHVSHSSSRNLDFILSILLQSLFMIEDWFVNIHVIN